MIPPAVKLLGCSLITACRFLGFMKRHRFFYILIFSALHVAAAFMLMYDAHDKKQARHGSANVSLAGVYINNFSVEVAHGGIISLIASNSQGRTKKLFVDGVTLLAFALGNILGPRVIWKSASSLSEGWASGRAAMGALAVVSFVALLGLFV